MRTAKELHKIKEAFALATMDMLDVFDELLETGRMWVEYEPEDNPTINDLVKNLEESNG